MVKNLPASGGDVRHLCLIPGLGRSPRGGHSNLLQYSCLENPMDRGAWRASVHAVTKSRTRLKGLRMHTCIVTKQNYGFQVSLSQSISKTLALHQEEESLVPGR